MTDEQRTDQPDERPAAPPIAGYDVSETPPTAQDRPDPEAGDTYAQPSAPGYYEQPGVIPPAAPPAVGQERTVPPVIPSSSHQDRRGMRPGATIAIAVLLAFIVSSFAGLAAGFLGARLASGTLIGRSAANSKITVVPSRTSDPAVAAAAAAVPAVVNIDVSSDSVSGGSEGLPDSHPSVPNRGNGSGVSYKKAEDGGTYILTNNHVVQSAKSIVVRDSTGKAHDAELVGRDPESDIAVVKVKVALATIDVSDSSELLVGQSVVAIGSPFGLEHSVTTGVVSALGRSLPDFSGGDGTYPLVDVIQTDAAINPGNSGGALVNSSGRLIGINTAIYTESDGNAGVGFAIPVNTAISIGDQLIAGGEVSHPFIGVIGQSVTRELAQQENLTVDEGAYVAEVAKDSGASKADVKTGDVIVAVEGKPIRSMDDLILQVRRKKIGDEVRLSIVRGSQKVEVLVTVGDKPAEYGAPSAPNTPSRPSTPTPRND